MKVTLYTYSDSGTQVGSEDSETFTVTVPPSTKPTVAMSLSPVHNLPAAFNGIYVQGLSKVKAVLTATTQFDASVSYYDMTVGGKTYGLAEDYTSDYLTSTGTVSVTGHAVDSRSYGGYTPGSITVLPYAHPKIQNVTAQRCNASGALSDSGTYLKITAKRSYSPVVSNKVQKNFCEIRYRYKAESASSYSSWVTILAGSNLSSDTVTTGALLGNLLATTSYRVEVQAVDDIGYTSLATVVVSTDKVYWHRDGANNALGLGKYAEASETLDSAWNLKTNKNIEAAGNATIGGTMRAANIGSIGYYRQLDFNTLTTQTGYYVDSSTPGQMDCTNYPVDKTGMLAVIAVGGSFAYQTYCSHDGDIYTRSYYSGTGWSVWKQVAFV
jgi:hypothetical protein